MADPVNPFQEMYEREQADKRRKEEEDRRRFPPGRSMPERIAPLPKVVDVGEIVAGAQTAAELGTIIVVDGYAGSALVLPLVPPGAGPQASRGLLSPNPDGFHIEKAAYGTSIPVSPGTPRTLRAVFHPLTSGEYESQFVFRVLWDDRNYSEHRIVVRGKARGLDDVPANAGMDSMEPATLGRGDPQLKRAPPLDADMTSIDAATATARDSVDAISDAQRDGVTLAEREAMSFVETPPEPSILAILADVAISMGLAGIAGVIARGAARHLVGLKIQDPVALRESRSLLGATDALKEGIKGLSKATVIPTFAKSRKVDPTLPPATGVFSSNSTIDFWAHQRSVISTLKSGFKKEVSQARQLAQAMEPASGLIFMQAIARSFHESGNNGEIVVAQALASEVQWISGIAQSTLTSSIARDPVNGDRMTSDLTWLRTNPKFALRDGVIRVRVVVSAASAPTVRSAKIKGISQEIADRVWRTPLLTVPIPVVLEVHDGAKATRITRDEAGRIRAQSEILLPGEASTESEPGMIAEATQMVGMVLSKSLADWGVKEVETNDATGREK